MFKKQAENVQEYLTKGSLVSIEGRLQSRRYQDKEDRTVFVTEVICDSVQFLESKKEREKNQQSQQPTYSNQPRENDHKLTDAQDLSDDDLPF